MSTRPDSKRELERQGILLRYYSTPGLADCVRITIGTPEQNERALAALRDLVDKEQRINGR